MQIIPGNADPYYSAPKHKPKPRTFTCEICGDESEQKSRANRKQRVCTERCKPREGFKTACVRCGEVKGYWEFGDYRGSCDGGFKRTCKACDCESALKRYHEKKEEGDE